MSIRTFITMILFCAVMVETDAQSVATDSIENDTITSPEVKQSLPQKLDTKLTNKYFKTKYDTNYVVRPDQKWLVRLLVNQTGDHIHAKGTVRDVWSKYDLHTRQNTTFSLEVNYCDLAASLSINPAKTHGDYNDYELNLEYHGNQFSIDANYQRATSLAGDIKLGNIDHLDEEGLRMNVVNIAGYYTFNHRRFSFPAALYQNYYQVRSAGSWLAGVSFQGGSIKTTRELQERSPEAPVVHINFGHVGIGGGYGYNLVLGKRSQWLLHLSALPTVVVYNYNKLTVNGMEIKAKHMRVNMIFNERAAVIYHFAPRYFAGASLMMSNSLFDDKAVIINQNKWIARAFLGVRL